MAASGYELQWSLRSGGGASAETGGANGTVSEAPARGILFPGPIGRRLSAHLDEILDVLARTGVTDPRLYGDVADGCESVGSWVVIGVTISAQANQRDVLAASGPIGLLVDANVRILGHGEVGDYGWDGDGVPLTGGESPPIRRCG